MRFEHVPPRTVRFWAWVDSSVTYTLALPFVAPGFLRLLYRINGWMGGAAIVPAFEPIQWFFVCLSGAMVSLWVIVRLLRPLGIFAVIDGYGRIWVSALILYFVILEGAPQVLLLFVGTEMAGAIAQLRIAYRNP